MYGLWLMMGISVYILAGIAFWGMTREHDMKEELDREIKLALMHLAMHMDARRYTGDIQ